MDRFKTGYSRRHGGSFTKTNRDTQRIFQEIFTGLFYSTVNCDFKARFQVLYII